MNSSNSPSNSTTIQHLLSSLQTFSNHPCSCSASTVLTHLVTLQESPISYGIHSLVYQNLHKINSFLIFSFQLWSIYRNLQVLIFNSKAHPRYPGFLQVDFQDFLRAIPFTHEVSPGSRCHLCNNYFFTFA